MKRLVDFDEFHKCTIEKVSRDREAALQEFQNLQIAAYVMAGGGFIGEMAAEQPWGFYIDTRVGKRPYSTTKICNMVGCVKVFAETLGFNSTTIPKMKSFPYSHLFSGL